MTVEHPSRQPQRVPDLRTAGGDLQTLREPEGLNEIDVGVGLPPLGVHLLHVGPALPVGEVREPVVTREVADQVIESRLDREDQRQSADSDARSLEIGARDDPGTRS